MQQHVDAVGVVVVAAPHGLVGPIEAAVRAPGCVGLRPGCMGLQPLVHRVAASGAWGCSLLHVWLQRYAHMAPGAISCRMSDVCSGSSYT